MQDPEHLPLDFKPLGFLSLGIHKDELLGPVQKYVRQLAATSILFQETLGTDQLVFPGCPQNYLKGIFGAVLVC